MTKQLFITGGILVAAVLVLWGSGIFSSPRKMPAVSVAQPLAATSSVAANATSSAQSATSNQGTSHAAQSTSTPPIVRVVEGTIYEHDYSVDKYLMGESHNVLVAKIIKQVATTTRAGTPATQFEAEVVFNIKGNAQGTITVEQEGGYLNGIL